jgi:hypothetical protein
MTYAVDATRIAIRRMNANATIVDGGAIDNVATRASPREMNSIIIEAIDYAGGYPVP